VIRDVLAGLLGVALSTPESVTCPVASVVVSLSPAFSSASGTFCFLTSRPTTSTYPGLWFGRTSDSSVADRNWGSCGRHSRPVVIRRDFNRHIKGAADGVVDKFEGGYAAYILQRVERQRRQSASSENAVQTYCERNSPGCVGGAPAGTTKPKFRIDAATALIADVPPPRDRMSCSPVRNATPSTSSIS